LPLSPAELSTALAVYVEAGSYAAAARAIGREESTTRKALRRHMAPERAELFAMELEAAQVNALRATRRARRKAVAALDATDDPRDVALLAHVIHENLRAISTARTSHGRLVAAEHAVATRVHEELRGAMERLRRALPPRSFEAALHALSDDSHDTATTMRGVVAEFGTELSTLTDQELHQRVARLVGSIHAEALATLDGLSAEELDARLRAGLTALVTRARAGDAEARGILAPLVAQVPDGTPVVLLPRLEPP
jgi:hypothetical protein